MTTPWTRIPCQASECPEWRRLIAGEVQLRSSGNPDHVLVFWDTEWQALIAAAKRGDLDPAGDTP